MTLINTSIAHRRPRGSILKTVAHLVAVHRQRKALAHMDDAALEDIGISRSEAEREAKRPIWDAPETWRC